MSCGTLGGVFSRVLQHGGDFARLLWLLEMTLKQQQGGISAAQPGSGLVASQTEGGATSLRGAQLRRMDFCGGEASLLVFGEHQEGVRAAEAAREVRWVLALLLHLFSCWMSHPRCSQALSLVGVWVRVSVP